MYMNKQLKSKHNISQGKGRNGMISAKYLDIETNCLNDIVSLFEWIILKIHKPQDNTYDMTL